MATSIFVNLPTKNLERAKAFYTQFGFSINPQFTNEKGACIVISDTICNDINGRVFSNIHT